MNKTVYVDLQYGDPILSTQMMSLKANVQKGNMYRCIGITSLNLSKPTIMIPYCIERVSDKPILHQRYDYGSNSYVDVLHAEFEWHIRENGNWSIYMTGYLPIEAKHNIINE